LIKTSFVPDEFWQGPEVAHNLVFGYGYLTWEWQQGLRGFTFPLFFAGAFKLLHILGMDSATALIMVPRVLQAILAAFGDLYLFKLSTKLFGKESAKWSLLCGLVSWFTFYCVTRTLTNSTETVLTTIALYYWPWTAEKKSKEHSNFILSLFFAALSCLIRPTSAIIWIPLSVITFTKSDRKVFFIFAQVLPVGVLALLWSVSIDSWFYGRLTLVQLNFVVFNVVKDMGTFYGSHPWHW
jgi:phosphatidylinositol glycan class B